MENDYEIIWTDLALEELQETVEYLEAMYYRIVENEIQILSFFSNRQNPTKRKI